MSPELVNFFCFVYSFVMLILVISGLASRADKKERAWFESEAELAQYNRRTAHLVTMHVFWPLWIPIGIAYGIYRYVRVMVKGY